MAVDLISNCFAAYVDANWNAGNYAKPGTIAVMSPTDSPGKFKGAQNAAILINRGDLQFLQVDLGSSSSSGGFRYRQWRTSIFCYETSSANLQGLMNEFGRLLSSWQSGGGGVFSADNTDVMAYIQDYTQAQSSNRSCDIDITFNGYYEQEVTV